MKYFIISFTLIVFLLSGCASGKRYAYMAGSGLIGGGIGYAIFDKNPLAVGIGAATGAILSANIQGEDEEVLFKSYQEGYLSGEGNSIRRQYWLKQSLERPSNLDGSRMVYYNISGANITQDGRKLVDHTVTIPILE